MFSEEEILKCLNELTLGTSEKANDLLAILRSEGFSREKNSLYIEILNSFSWHTARKMIARQRLGELLSDSVITALFPRDLRYNYMSMRNMM